MSYRLARRVAVLLVTVGIAGTGCSTGTDAVDPTAGGEFRFIAGDGTGTLLDAGKRQPAPHFTGRYLGGEAFDSASLAGKVVVLNFWAQWCAPCRVESPEFEQVHQATRAGGVEFLGVDVKDDQQLAQAFVANKKITYRSLFDPSGRVALAFRGYPPNAIPSTIVLDRRGRVAAVYLKALLASELQPVVTRLVEER